MGQPRFAAAWTVGLLCLAASAGIAYAGEIYKTVDANGNVTYSDHVESTESTVVQLEDPRYPPHDLHVCWKNCFTLSLDNGSYHRVDGVDDTWTIETFTAKAVVLHRHGTPTSNADVTYSGEVANDRLVNVKVNGTPTAGIDASWGSALNTLPANNAERDVIAETVASTPAGATVSTAAAPPPLPEENQSEIPQPGYLWTPGYWYWREQGYFWIPGAWVRAPQTGFLWTPGYWGLLGTLYVFHPGHWGPTVGYYGGVNYGHGYTGSGYFGGRWVGGSFVYNSSVNHLSPAVRNTYSEPVPGAISRHVSYSGGVVGVSSVSTVTTINRPAPVAANVVRTPTTRAAPNAPTRPTRPIKELPPK